MSKQKLITVIPDERIIGKIYLIRGEKVMFDWVLAVLYEVETKVLNQSVKRNIDRFPDDFMFKLNKTETEIWKSQIITSDKDSLRSQIVTSKRGGRRYEPFVFTEQGVAMLSSVLKSKRAVQVNIQIMRTFTKMRRLLASNQELAKKIEKIEKDNIENKDNFKIIFRVLAKLMKTDSKDKGLKVIGFEEK
ncbi:MAG: KilA-N, DNA-binding domain-containing protein [Candidatus Moranbacteria bacterium GW2011_GWE1_35_17]|nr:MAG: KilA-N, DNA-binding domain-containing protein [Candidatus Moranbacteria bacterium GW2011_GWE1_35_17]KKP71159.1 MAG: KilA-N, DNA-binding domain-containing protein [Candidatus Moranbacteria bacterium GW2011_GWE2_35_164]KKP83913.1 MAG: KilA-N, DNA-binding domain-containing protein [Candidatus Moranbacteria bacterium GW2011_GWF1_35_5]KKP84686.1 MAG: KilA-N, DNA-binding domain-containing protein [Candidatus Moranbacteria bacterium GW2011_GWF2_35_54]